ncbi:MAG: ATP-binding cassette domain-containing protein, partial [[Eubacterium] siraeum]
MMKLENVDKYYNINTSSEVHALKNINLSIEKGEMVAIMGVSSSGKSTLIHILGCLDKQTSGKYFLGEYEVSKYSNNEIAVIRNEEIGFVLQNFGLLADKTVYENISYPLIFNPAVKYKMMKKLILKTADAMLIGDLLKKP